MFKLARRHDGTTKCVGSLTMIVGESFPVWIDPSPLSGGKWLESVSSPASSDTGVVAITDPGVNRELVVLPLTALAEGTAEVTIEASRQLGNTIDCLLEVTVNAASA